VDTEGSSFDTNDRFREHSGTTASPDKPVTCTVKRQTSEQQEENVRKLTKDANRKSKGDIFRQAIDFLLKLGLTSQSDMQYIFKGVDIDLTCIKYRET